MVPLHVLGFLAGHGDDLPFRWCVEVVTSNGQRARLSKHFSSVNADLAAQRYNAELVGVGPQQFLATHGLGRLAVPG